VHSWLSLHQDQSISINKYLIPSYTRECVMWTVAESMSK
jgi:hypothetical protein